MTHMNTKIYYGTVRTVILEIHSKLLVMNVLYCSNVWSVSLFVCLFVFCRKLIYLFSKDALKMTV